MLDGLGYGLFAAFVWGLTDIAAALVARRFGGLLTVGIVEAASLVGLFVVSIVAQGGLVVDWSIAPRAGLLGMISALSYISFFTALALGPIAVVSPVTSAYGAFAVVLAVVVLGERLTGLQAAGALVGSLGILMIGLRLGGHWRQTRFVGPGVPLALLSLVLWGCVSIGTAILVRETTMGTLSVIVVARTANVAMVWTLLGVRQVRLRRRGASGPPVELVDADEVVALGERLALDERAESSASRRVPVRLLGLAVVGGLLDVSGYMVFALGMQRSLAWLVALSSSFGPAVAVLVAVAFLGERLRAVQWFGLAMLGLGVVLVGLR
jgi:drug/metabolite transporter (DMT)-like permease